jgi:hypothetical protein
MSRLLCSVPVVLVRLSRRRASLLHWLTYRPERSYMRRR